MSISPIEVLSLPHSQYLSFYKNNIIQDLQQTEEGREYLEKSRKNMNPRKKADYSAIRNKLGITQLGVK